jgi:transmembrane sensor
MKAARRNQAAEHPRATSDAVADSAAAQWVVRSAAGLDASAQKELEAWRRADPRNESSFQRLSALSQALHRARQMGATGAITAELQARARRRRTQRRMLVGAGLAAVLVLGLGLWIRQPSAPATTAAPPIITASKTVRRLPDGSRVELNGNSEIVVNYEPGFRRIELVHGEALFSVEKNPRRPFIVRAGGLEVRAVGTAFNVKLQNSGVEVLVTEGKVGLDATTGHAPLLARDPSGNPGVLVAGQRATIADVRPGAVQVSALTRDELADRLAWRRPRLEFSGVELAHAVERLNHTNHLQITLEGAGLGQLRLSGTFFSDDPETFSRLVAETFSLRTERRGDLLVLKPSEPAAR